MEEIQTASRRRSGVYNPDIGNPTQQSFDSQEGLRGLLLFFPLLKTFLTFFLAHAAAPAGGYITTGTPGAALSGWNDDVPTASAGLDVGSTPAAATIPKQPFYKRRWFIISQIILIPLSIALLFILLFPVVRAIIALVIKRTNLDIQAVVITQPVNGSYVLSLENLHSFLSQPK